jgi:hypothetical protein
MGEAQNLSNYNNYAPNIYFRLKFWWNFWHDQQQQQQHEKEIPVAFFWVAIIIIILGNFLYHGCLQDNNMTQRQNQISLIFCLLIKKWKFKLHQNRILCVCVCLYIYIYIYIYGSQNYY